MAVVVSASAAAQAAFSTAPGVEEACHHSSSARCSLRSGFLIAEKFFADAERRVAAQSRQAALSELFFAQVAWVQADASSI